MNKLINAIEFGEDVIMSEVKESIRIMNYQKKSVEWGDKVWAVILVTISIVGFLIFVLPFIKYLLTN